METENKLREEHEALLVLLRKNFKELTGYSGVSSTGVGLRMKDGKYTNELCIYVEVEKKLPANQLQRGQMIPSQISNVKVDVVEKKEKVEIMLKIKPEELINAPKIRPLQGGTQITNGIVDSGGNVSVGTLGAMIYVPLKKDAFTGILSCHHVLYANGAGNGQSIGQPYSDDAIATNYAGKTMGTELDMAVAKINSDIKFTNDVISIGTLCGIDNAYVKQRVRKSGITTGLTVGQITKVGVWCDEHTCVYTGLEVIRGYPELTPDFPFAQPGDSGSVLVSNEAKVLGLVWAIGNFDNTCYCNDVRRMQQLAGEFKIPTPNATQMTQLLSDTKRLEKYKYELSESETGQEMLAELAANIEEGIKLVNKNRECMVAWQRVKGPDFISLQTDLDTNEDYVLRKEIEGVTLSEMIMRMGEVFAVHGSPQLSAVVKKYTSRLLAYTRECNTMEDVIKKINEKQYV